ncbi:ABC transporter permease (plasmid) [Streptomyces clavuligerus]|uniref:Binding-protein-dependent transport systems inner membrane component n=1 Tax=Streptomyces clavuligerus TaxID=1901 RepID=B5GMH7_STRCL|nr:ABC transporter permease [Streptomyces clavuligerus]ANW22387.1 ABC transporter permease [Streptomyces clavuligerus]AXU17293.1 ABC transporter permease [Streptomyces clavuligerus]EDY47523.1 glycine betaine/carnitine/choline ABC transporter [Streptomyces clavuligerus]EFG04486.1 Binding-protein-dependent transport systems inner membrane component [Streptomyces clavuligerus]MBY6307061.1 ABC transporter permease [Streptomyces clavuligerus]
MSTRLRRHLTTPAVIATLLALLYVWVHARPLDSIEQRTLNPTYITDAVTQHLWLTSVSTVLVLVLALGGGILLTRPALRRLAPLVTGLANIGQAAPAIGLLVLLSLWWGIGFGTAVMGMVAYSVLPVLRNTIVGIQQVDAPVVDAARGLGMGSSAVLFRVELPLAVPVILAGIRTALVFNVGVGTLATFVNAGGLGDMIVNGIKLQRTPVLVTGAVLVASLALLIDWLGSVVEDRFRTR